MLFGSPHAFAIEALLEPDPQFGAVQSNNLVGRFCLWMNGTAVGRIDEPSCWLGPFREHLRRHAASLEEHWQLSFDALTPEQIFDHLDRGLYAAHRDECLDLDDIEDAGDLGRFSFLTNVSEVFDGWTAFLVSPAGSDDILALVRAHGAPTVSIRTFSRTAFRDAVCAFSDWVDAEQRRLVPHLFA